MKYISKAPSLFAMYDLPLHTSNPAEFIASCTSDFVGISFDDKLDQAILHLLSQKQFNTFTRWYTNGGFRHLIT